MYCNKICDNRFMASKKKLIIIYIKIEDLSIENLNFDKKTNSNYEDIMIKEETKPIKFKNSSFIN